MLIEISEKDYEKINEYEIAVKAETLQDAIIRAIAEAKGVINRVNGHWIHDVIRGRGDVTVCSNCAEIKEGIDDTAFCPHCGADMRKDGEQ